MRFVGAVIGLPDRIVFALVVISPSGSYITAGFVRLVINRTVAIAEIFSASYQEESAAQLTAVWNIVFLDAA